MLNGFLDAIQGPVWVAKVTLQTRSLTGARLYWLNKRRPPRVPGTFRFPFGSIRYIDALSLLTIYSEIYFRRVYDVNGLIDNPCIIDCGGNIGLSAIWFKQRYPNASITIFEADPSIADVLEGNIKALGMKPVEVVRAAVSDISGPVTFSPDGTLSGRIESGDGLVVESVRLSDIIREPIDLLKIDIEGSEFGLIKDLCVSGKVSLIKNIVCEVHGCREVQDQVAELWSNLSKSGFCITVGETESGSSLPGPAQPTPFPSASSNRFVLYLYAWR